MRECFSCAGQEPDVQFPGRTKPGQPPVCTPCKAEADRAAAPLAKQGASISRRRYRALRRFREASPQADLLDLITPCP